MTWRGAVSCLVSTESLPVNVSRNLICPFFSLGIKGVFAFGLIDSSKEWEKCEEES